MFRNVVVRAWVPESTSDAHPEHPIYVPVVPPPDSGLSPEHPIYIPVGGDEHPEHPIFIPGPPSDAHPEHPIYYPIDIGEPLPPEVTVPPEALDKLVEFLTGNLPENPDPRPEPV